MVSNFVFMLYMYVCDCVYQHLYVLLFSLVPPPHHRPGLFVLSYSGLFFIYLLLLLVILDTYLYPNGREKENNIMWMGK